jgi:hypothetical protein
MLRHPIGGDKRQKAVNSRQSPVVSGESLANDCNHLSKIKIGQKKKQHFCRFIHYLKNHCFADD